MNNAEKRNAIRLGILALEMLAQYNIEMRDLMRLQEEAKAKGQDGISDDDVKMLLGEFDAALER